MITTKEILKYTTKITIDDKHLYKVTGKIQSDHNTIIVDLETPKRRKINLEESYRWKINDKTDWNLYQETVETSQINKIRYNELNINDAYQYWIDTITKVAQITLGKKAIQPLKKRTVSEEIRKARKDKRQARKEYEKAIDTKCEESIRQTKDKYMKAQKDVHAAIDANEADWVTKKLKEISSTGGVHSKHFWNIKRGYRNTNAEDLAILKDEEGNEVVGPDLVKEHIASYYEQLFARG